MHVFAVTSPWMSALGNAINLAFCHVQPGGSLFLRKGFWGEDFWSLETAAAVLKSRRAAVDFLNVHVARSGQWRTVWCVTSAVRAFAGKRSFSPRGSSPRFRGCAGRVDCVRFITACSAAVASATQVSVDHSCVVQVPFVPREQQLLSKTRRT